MRIAVFISHPIQYFTPLWQELSATKGIRLKVFYFSRQGLDVSFDPGFGRKLAWDMDLLGGHEHEFLPRQWPTSDPLDYSGTGLNSHVIAALRQGWDAAFVSGYGHINNWVVVAACKAMNIPTICYGDSNANTDRGKPRWKRAVKRAALTPFMRNISAFVAPGGQTRSYFVGYGARRESVFICPFVVDVSGFRRTIAEAGPVGLQAMRERFGLPAGKRVIAFGGKLVAWKRPLDLVYALKKLDRDDVVGLFIGDGSLRDEIAQAGAELARIAGFVNRSEIPLALRLADILVLPSEVEPFGLIVSEAHALGIPCVVSDRCGCYGPDSVLQDGHSGFVYPCGDVDQLASRIRTLLDDDSLYRRFSSAALAQGELQSPRYAAAGLISAVEYAAAEKGPPGAR